MHFQAEGPPTYLRGRGWEYCVRLDRECNDFKWLVGHSVHIVVTETFRHDGYLCMKFTSEVDGVVLAVERFAHAPPFRPGEKIGILLESEPTSLQQKGYFSCKECGPKVSVDDDGCCTMCGATCTTIEMGG